MAYLGVYCYIADPGNLETLYVSARIKANKKTVKTSTPKDAVDRRILLFKRNRNYWMLFRIAGVSMWLVGQYLP